MKEIYKGASGDPQSGDNTERFEGINVSHRCKLKE